VSPRLQVFFCGRQHRKVIRNRNLGLHSVRVIRNDESAAGPTGHRMIFGEAYELAGRQVFGANHEIHLVSTNINYFHLHRMEFSSATTGAKMTSAPPAATRPLFLAQKVSTQPRQRVAVHLPWPTQVTEVRSSGS